MSKHSDNINGLLLIPVVLSGGSGSRLWPVSRALHPKPFIKLGDGQNLLQKTYLRALSIPNVKKLLTVTNRELYFQSKDSFHDIYDGDVPVSFLLEPFGRNTAPAVASAALYAAKEHGEDAILLILAADHVIENEDAFRESLKEAVSFASKGKLVTFGIKPTAPKTGYGYIEADGNSVLRFVEKPCEDVAKEYVTSGNFLWNSGMFCFSAGVILKEMEKHCPELLSAVKNCIEHAESAAGYHLDQVELDPELFKQVPDISIDYAVMEKSDNVAVVSCDIGWNDVGSWVELGTLMNCDDSGNYLEGEVVLENSSNCIIQGNKRLVAGVDINDLIIVDTTDALLVADKNKAQKVKEIYNKLKKDEHEAHKLHKKVYRPWGSYETIEEGDGFKIKRIEVKSRASLSLQMHKHRNEHWVVICGKAKVINGDEEILLGSNESTYIEAGKKHRLENVGEGVLIIIEVQCGSYLGEDDIVRFEDVYGRL